MDEICSLLHLSFVGKPYPLVYDACATALRRAGVPSSARVVAVGDSLHHDVLGAARAGIDSVLVCGGVHYQALGIPQAQAAIPDPDRLKALLEEFSDSSGGCRPTHIVAGFVTNMT